MEDANIQNAIPSAFVPVQCLPSFFSVENNISNTFGRTTMMLENEEEESQRNGGIESNGNLKGIRPHDAVSEGESIIRPHDAVEKSGNLTTPAFVPVPDLPFTFETPNPLRNRAMQEHQIQNESVIFGQSVIQSVQEQVQTLSNKTIENNPITNTLLQQSDYNNFNDNKTFSSDIENMSLEQNSDEESDSEFEDTNNDYIDQNENDEKEEREDEKTIKNKIDIFNNNFFNEITKKSLNKWDKKLLFFNIREFVAESGSTSKQRFFVLCDYLFNKYETMEKLRDERRTAKGKNKPKRKSSLHVLKKMLLTFMISSTFIDLNYSESQMNGVADVLKYYQRLVFLYKSRKFRKGVNKSFYCS
ncbi:hypothetical protein EIN_299690 [Entamoeba invadens IP1]|uniref:Uncharacterized protein n=1 Tax=Entamoeba invadens IP1 TaxID=370355 RepID=A0A0A1U6J9_ENTIV|nr:hypothetical protein EIN_299690 [Entamoeba invadens IP1]ELP89940.1 hypothetical protein EIN_299690 [Entamoeba invadens IP1]|eukprot:XP_004256711.1 hypothetical protein EIN_299690 [Entamoeba invadens IP1]